MSKLALEVGIIALTPTADQTHYRGYFVEASSGSAAICNAATDLPIGVIVDGQPTTGQSSIAVAPGLIVKVKVTGTGPGTIANGTLLTLKADGTVQADAGSGARVQVARALEAGAANELITACLLQPVALAAAVVVAAPAATTTVNGAVAGLNSTAVNPTKADFDALLGAVEKIADEQRADNVKLTEIHTALVALGLLAAS